MFGEEAYRLIFCFSLTSSSMLLPDIVKNQCCPYTTTHLSSTLRPLSINDSPFSSITQNCIEITTDASHYNVPKRASKLKTIYQSPQKEKKLHSMFSIMGQET